MKLIIDGYNKSIHKKDNQLTIYEKDEIRMALRHQKSVTLQLLEKDMPHLCFKFNGRK